MCGVELGDPVPDELLKRSNTLVPVEIEGLGTLTNPVEKER